MARLLLLSIFSIAICFTAAAKIDHTKKSHLPPSDGPSPQESYSDMPPTDLPPHNKAEYIQSTEVPFDDSTGYNTDTELGNDMGPIAGPPSKGPSPPKPSNGQKKTGAKEIDSNGPKMSGPQEYDSNVPSKPVTSKKTLPIKQGSQKPSGGKVNLGSAVKLMINAQPGIDFPAYSMDDMPHTSFSCDEQQYPGYYADPEAQCQVFHYCPFKVEGMITVPISFLCPNYTVFDQRTLSCNWFYQVDCSQAVNFYEKINSRLYQTALPLIDDEPGTYEHQAPSMTKANNKRPVPNKKPKKVKEEEESFPLEQN